MLHVDTEVDEQTMLFFYIQAFLLPEDEVAEELKYFFIRHPFQYSKKIKWEIISALAQLDLLSKSHGLFITFDVYTTQPVETYTHYSAQIRFKNDYRDIRRYWLVEDITSIGVKQIIHYSSYG